MPAAIAVGTPNRGRNRSERCGIASRSHTDPNPKRVDKSGPSCGLEEQVVDFEIAAE